ncbi:hypothetical protein [Lacticaseibacillus saniviri]
MNHNILELAPYLAGIVTAFVGLLTFGESKRKSKHDELMDLYDKVNEDNDRLRKENESLKKQLEEKENK